MFLSDTVIMHKNIVRLTPNIVDLPTSRASKAELGAKKIYTMQEKTEGEARSMGHLQAEKAAKDFGKVYKSCRITYLSNKIIERKIASALFRKQGT